METVNAIQETYNIWNWLSPLISGAIGALIWYFWRSLFFTLEAREENQKCTFDGY